MYSCTMRQLADTQLKATLMCSSNSMATYKAGSQRGWCRASYGAAPALDGPGPAPCPHPHPHPHSGPTCRISQLTFHWRMLLKRQVLTTSPTAKSMRISRLLAMPRISSFLLPLNLAPKGTDCELGPYPAWPLSPPRQLDAVLRSKVLWASSSSSG